MVAEKKKILLVPLDPVHDMGLKLIRKALDDKGHSTVLLPQVWNLMRSLNGFR